MPDFLHSSLTPFFAVLIASIPIATFLVQTILTWAKDLGASARRIRQLEEQSKVVAFWDSWIKTEALLKTSSESNLDVKGEETIAFIRNEARRELSRVGEEALFIYRKGEYAPLLRFKLTFEEFHTYRSALPWYRRALLLYKAPNPQAKLQKVLFHFVICWTVFIRLIFRLPSSIRLLHRFWPETPNPTWMTSGYVVGMVIASSLLTIGTALLMRHLAIRYENNPILYPAEKAIKRLRETSPKEAGAVNGL